MNVQDQIRWKQKGRKDVEKRFYGISIRYVVDRERAERVKGRTSDGCELCRGGQIVDGFERV